MNPQSRSTLLLSAIVIFIVSCSKQEDVLPPDNKISLIQKHTWILDSTNTITANYNVMQSEVPPSSYVFSADTIVINFHGTILINYGAVYEAPDKIYYWTTGGMKNVDEYIIIETVTDTKLKSKEVYVASGETRTRYFHAQ